VKVGTADNVGRNDSGFREGKAKVGLRVGIFDGLLVDIVGTREGRAVGRLEGICVEGRRVGFTVVGVDVAQSTVTNCDAIIKNDIISIKRFIISRELNILRV
jgi:hypothetical protein